MKIAAVSDIHGNLPALEAVLADIDSIGVDHVVFCGDIVLGAPDDKACWERVKADWSTDRSREHRPVHG